MICWRNYALRCRHDCNICNANERYNFCLFAAPKLTSAGKFVDFTAAATKITDREYVETQRLSRCELMRPAPRMYINFWRIKCFVAAATARRGARVNYFCFTTGARTREKGKIREKWRRRELLPSEELSWCRLSLYVYLSRALTPRTFRDGASARVDSNYALGHSVQIYSADPSCIVKHLRRKLKLRLSSITQEKYYFSQLRWHLRHGRSRTN